MKSQLKLFLLTIMLFLLSAPNFAQDNPFIDVAHLGGEIKCSAIKGDYAFIGQANYLIVVDKTQDNFEQKAEIKFNEVVEDLFISDNYIFIVSDSLFIIDISNPLDPVLKSSVKLDEPSNKIFVDNMFAYVSRFGSISIFNISDATTPQYVSTYSTGQSCDDLFVKGNYLYCIDRIEEKLFIFNIEDKSNIDLVKLLNQSQPTSIDIIDNYLYLTTQKYPDIGLNIYDISDPEVLVKKGFFETKTVDGNHIYLRNPYKVKVQGDRAYIVCTSGQFFTVDISDKQNPTELGHTTIFDIYSSIFSMDIDNDKVYLALYSLGFKEVDISENSNPVLSNKLNEVSRINCMQADSNYFVAASREGLWIYNNKPDKPTLIKQYEKWTDISHFSMENKKIIALFQDSITIIDITKPLDAKELSSYKPIAHPNEVFTSGNYVYIAINGDKKTLDILDISNTQNPNKVGSVEIPGVAADIFVDSKNKKAFVTYFLDDTKYGYVIIDISDSVAPTLISDNKTIGIPSPIHSQGDSVFIGSNTGDFDNPEWHLEIFDISDLNSPTLVAKTNGEGNIWDLEVFDETIFAGIAGQSIFEMMISPYGTIDIVDISHSLNTIGINIFDLNGFYEIYTLEGYKYKKEGEEKTKGGGGVRKKKKKKKKNGGESCCLTTEVQPPKAAADGCRVTPEGCTSGGCGSEVDIEAIQTTDWLFYKWSGAVNSSNIKEKATYKDKPCEPGVQCENIAVANFTPWFLIKGGNTSVECPVRVDGDTYGFNFALQASLPDDWLVTSVKVKLSGDDKVLSYLSKAKLDWGNSYELIGKGAGFYKFITDNLIVAKGTTRPMYLELTFDEMTDLECPFDPTSIKIEIKTAYVMANPAVFTPGIIIGTASGEKKIGCILNENQEKQYSSIQLAVIDAKEGESINLCPGTYEENVIVNKILKISSFNGPKETIVKAALKDKDVFSLEAEGIEISSLTLFNSNKAGINIQKDDCKLSSCIIKENLTGILITAANCSVLSNEIINNTGDGIKLSGSTCKKTIITLNKIGLEGDSNEAPNGNGIKITEGSSENHIFINNILGNKNVGIMVNENSGNNIIEDNGIGAKIDEDIILPNQTGLQISNSANNSVRKNKISGNKENGITIDGSNANGNIIENNTIGAENKINSDFANNNGIELSNGANNNTIGYGNYISGNRENGILLGYGTGNNRIEGNNIGVYDLGKKAIPNECGIYLYQSNNNSILDNIISGNKKEGFLFIESSKNTIEGNHIGTDGEGETAIPNEIGIELSSSSNANKIINGNVISGNKEIGIKVNIHSERNLIKRNYIGTDGKGEKAIPNKNGIIISFTSKENEISEGNVISGNIETGIKIEGVSDGNLIKGNYIGTDGKGETAISNNTGIFMSNSFENRITEGNVISGNKENGIKIEKNSENNLVKGNHIGVDQEGVGAIPNKTGIYIQSSYLNTVSENIISGNEENGISGIYAENNDINNNVIGLDIFKTDIIQNKNGIVLSNSDENLINKNIISGNEINGIKFTTSNKNIIEENQIGVAYNPELVFPNKNGIFILQSNANKIRNNNTITGNTDDGIVLSNSQNNIVNNNYIGSNIFNSNQKTGVKILQGLKETITNNSMIFNCVGIKIIDSKQSKVANNYITNSSCGSSSIHLENSEGKISGNNITKDAGDAINCSKGSNPFVVKNNIFDNIGFALNNEDPNVHIIAQNNWWGENANPGSSINGDVDYTNWSVVSNNLVIATEVDTAYTAPSQSGSLNLYYRNWKYAMDSINIFVTDSLGWIDSLNQSTFVFPDSLGGQNIVYYSVPDVPKGTIDKVIVKAISQIDTNWTNIDSFFIRAYNRALVHIDIDPDSIISMVLNDSLKFNAVGLDSFNNFFLSKFIWSCTGGEIDSTGLYYATEIGSFDIVVSNTDSTIWAKTEVTVLPVGTFTPTKVKKELILYQNQPNPFSDKTKIKFTLNKSGNTSLIIYDFMGNKQKILINNWYPEGTYETIINGKALIPGQYFYELRQGNKRVVKKMVVN